MSRTLGVRREGNKGGSRPPGPPPGSRTMAAKNSMFFASPLEKSLRTPMSQTKTGKELQLGLTYQLKDGDQKLATPVFQ